MRGATAATIGSSKCPRSGESQSAVGSQSESTKATSGVLTMSSPAFLAPDGPALAVRPMNRASKDSAIASVRAGSDDASSTTTQDRPSRSDSNRCN